MRTGSKKAQDPRPSLADRVGLYFSTGRVVDGIWVGAIESSEAEPILRRVEEALGLIKAYDKRRYNRLINDLDRVCVWLLPGALAQFSRALRACVLDRRFLHAETTSPELLATVIVHEATHARLWHCGIGYGENLRQRVEAVCYRQQLAFAHKLPNGQSVCDGSRRFHQLSGRMRTLPSGIWRAVSRLHTTLGCPSGWYG